MIELPEAINITKQINNELVGKKINHVSLDNYAGLVKQGFMKRSPTQYQDKLQGKTIISASNKGKYFFLKLDSNDYLVIGFETSGNILFHKASDIIPKYTLRLDFLDGTIFTTRIIAWGFLLVEPIEFFQSHKYISYFGMSPLDDKLTFEKFQEMLSKHNKSIKTFFVGQKYISGIGNGYLQDILFKAKIHPKRKVPSLTLEEQKNLFTTMQKIMKDAIQKNGRDTETDLHGEIGSYHALMGNHMLNQLCKICGTKIEKQHVDGSAAYICSKCQKI